MPDKLILQAKEQEPTGRGSCVVRIGSGSAKAIRDLAYRTRQSDREIVDTLLAFALERVELVPVELYDMRMKEDEKC